MNTSNDSEAMKEAGALAVATYQEIVGYMRDLDTHTSALHWKGQAATLFRQTMDAWSNEFNGVLKELDSIADRLVGGAGNVEQAEDYASGQAFFN
ncbi:hypothetical protein GCM10027290_61570 [Micromonospora sonneratiae]|uniref:WXG100 family type VII secretion target n=1 Tax=Micromonospora sonneratiae TaxID=1184706 RepID=A0ABW3YJ75_9ACTN